MKIRTRLTLLYAGAFFVAGALLIALMYFYLQQSLDHRPGSAAEAALQQFAGEHGLRNMPVLENLVGELSAQADAERRDTLQTMLVFSLISLGAIGIAAGGFGWLLAGRVLQPLHDVTATARRVAEGNLQERIALRGPDDEIKILADTFDAMLERLDRAFASQHRFVANASHELRTPLAINRTLLEVALEDPQAPDATRRLGESLLAVNQRQERLIDGLLVLASSEQRLGNRRRVDLTAAAYRAVVTSDSAATLAGVTLRTGLSPSFVTGDQALLERLVQNLVDNAIRYNSTERGWVGVAVSQDGGRVRLVVENSGRFVAPTDVDGLFEPFRRHTPDDLDRSATLGAGAGLGLSIVRSVTHAHDGQVNATARPGGGLTVEVTLPASQ